MTKIKGKKPYTIEDWKKETDAARKRAKYWEEKSRINGERCDYWDAKSKIYYDGWMAHREVSEELQKEKDELTLAYKTDVATLQNCNADLRGSKDELFKLYEERAALLDTLSSTVSEKSKTIENLLSQNESNEQVLNKVKGDCMILESHNTDLIHSIISTKVLATVGWIFVFILLLCFVLLK